MNRLFITFFYSGLSPVAPGTVGSLAAALVGYFILEYLGVETLFLLTILISLVAVKEIDRYEASSGTHDDKSIVIDEVAGLWLAFAFSFGSLTQLILCFIYFRIYDIWKPSLIGRIDKNVKGGLGVMGDDLLAGVLAGISSALTWEIIKIISN